MSLSGSLHNILHETIQRTHCVQIRPHRLIVAWHGVLTLCFEAWPKPLAEVKRRINNEPEFQSLVENFGTRWPKLTLAAMNDHAPTLTLDQLRDLTKLCQTFDAELQQIGDYPFKKERDNNIEQEYDEESFKIVQNVVSETDQQLDKYLDKVNANGHRWGEHYNSIWTETTLVCFLTNGNESNDVTSRLLALLESFQKQVDVLLPDQYVWMPQKSLHLSLRALDNRSNGQRG